jgi:hypothetical protein
MLHFLYRQAYLWINGASQIVTNVARHDNNNQKAFNNEEGMMNP